MSNPNEQKESTSDVNASNVMCFLLRYEMEGLEEEKELALFQYLVRSGMAWELQGSYGRRAADLIEGGLISA